MFLTRMQINGQRKESRRLLSSPQSMHAAVLAGFPDPRPTEDGRVLWRLDTYRNKVLLFIASPDPPDLTHLVEQAGWPSTETWQTKPYKPLLGSLRIGQQWHFRLAANPVRSGRRPGWADTKPMGHVTADQQVQWLLDRSQRLGFRCPPNRVDDSLPDVVVVDRGVQRFRRGNSRVTLAVATFEGMLEVADVDMLKRTLAFGIGRAKSYGCGLLTLAAPSQVQR